PAALAEGPRPPQRPPSLVAAAPVRRRAAPVAAALGRRRRTPPEGEPIQEVMSKTPMPRIDPDKVQLLHGPYRCPRRRRGDPGWRLCASCGFDAQGGDPALGLDAQV